MLDADLASVLNSSIAVAASRAAPIQGCLDIGPGKGYKRKRSLAGASNRRCYRGRCYQHDHNMNMHGM